MSDFGFAPPTAVIPGEMVQFGADNRLWVQFYARSVHNPWKSQNEGRPVFEQRDFVKIIHPGERDCIDREVVESDPYRFQRQWADYQAKREQKPDGTPLAILYPHEPQFVDMLNALHIYTVEMLAELSEPGIAKLGMGGREHVQRAQRFMEAATGAKGAHKMQIALDQANDRSAVLEQQLAAMQRELAELREDRPRRGRPPKSTDEQEA